MLLKKHSIKSFGLLINISDNFFPYLLFFLLPCSCNQFFFPVSWLKASSTTILALKKFCLDSSANKFVHFVSFLHFVNIIWLKDNGNLEKSHNTGWVYEKGWNKNESMKMFPGLSDNIDKLSLIKLQVKMKLC